MPTDRRRFLACATMLTAGAAAPVAGRALAQSRSSGSADADAEPVPPPIGGEPMRRPIPGTRETLPAIGLGTADAFDSSTQGLQQSPLSDVLAMLLRTPGSVLDTAPSYGTAEAVAGELLRLHNARRQVFLATKISAPAASAPAQWARSQRELHSEAVDLLQVHNLIDWQENLRFLRQLQEQGKTRYIGVTHYRADAHAALEQIVRSEKIDFVQVNYSVGEREAERTLLPLCRQRGIAVLINRPFQDGRLFRAVQGKPLPPWAGELDCASWGQLFLKFIISHPAVTAAIPATSKPRHMRDNLGAALGRMPDAKQRERIAALVA
ncbi:aldo/keto reductase [Cupriavidus sp. AU9028]|uniref:aldo/keto reductase n=1 Tax=Cupriavidus sp. AU9028 TaxID=2871157 RepID=UPI001C956728|nr:aldo/keto reductase [Cupriavidus sp. AU9028]MBY4896017.1 aldo/keto reductase [Cupriavidus sp. AU9028]